MVMATIDYDGTESGGSQYSDEVDQETWAAATSTSRTDTDAVIGDGTSEITTADPQPSESPEQSPEQSPDLSAGLVGLGVIALAAAVGGVGG